MPKTPITPKPKSIVKVIKKKQTVKAIDFQTAISLCVLPFLIPEAIKTALAIFMVRVIPTRVKAFR